MERGMEGRKKRMRMRMEWEEEEDGGEEEAGDRAIPIRKGV